MANNHLRTAAEEELMEARLDGYNQKRKTGKETNDRNDTDEKPVRSSRRSELTEAKAGRWVAPAILGLTVLISGILWLLQTVNNFK